MIKAVKVPTKISSLDSTQCELKNKNPRYTEIFNTPSCAQNKRKMERRNFS